MRLDGHRESDNVEDARGGTTGVGIVEVFEIDLPEVPLVMDLAKTDEQRNILKLIFGRQVMGRPFVAPPDVPKDRVAILRKAFMDTMADKEFLADAEKAKFEITPVPGEKIENLVLDVYRNTTPALAEKAGAAMK